MMTDLLLVIGMVIDLLTGGDPTLPSNHEKLAPIAQTLAHIHDLVQALRCWLRL